MEEDMTPEERLKEVERLAERMKRWHPHPDRYLMGEYETQYKNQILDWANELEYIVNG